MNLPNQECWGVFCPVFSNLKRASQEVVGRYDPVKCIPLAMEMFPHLENVSGQARQSGQMLREFLGQ